MRYVIPTIRAALTGRLREKYRLKQEDISRLLRIRQSAVSQYLTGKRGVRLRIQRDREVQVLLDSIAGRLKRRNLSSSELMRELCRACTLIRSKKMVCGLHKSLDEDVPPDCALCLSGKSLCNVKI